MKVLLVIYSVRGSFGNKKIYIRRFISATCPGSVAHLSYRRNTGEPGQEVLINLRVYNYFMFKTVLSIPKGFEEEGCRDDHCVTQVKVTSVIR